MKLLGPVLACCLFATACGSGGVYQNVNELPQDARDNVDVIKNYYMDKAKTEAAFVTGCPKENATVSVLSTRKQRYVVRHGVMNGVYLDGDIIESLGVDACGQKIVYKVICGNEKRYGAGPLNSPGGYSKPCEVVANAKGDKAK